MPAILRFSNGYPTDDRPVKSSVSIAPDGLVSVSAMFLVPDRRTGAMPVESALRASLFSGLRDVALQASQVFVESRSFEKVGGLHYLSINAVGAVNPPPTSSSTDISPRSFNKTVSRNIFGQTVTLQFSFDYLAETNTVSSVFIGANRFPLRVPEPQLIQVYNYRGNGVIFGNQTQGPFARNDDSLVATPRVLTSETVERRTRIVRLTRTAQLIYE